LLPHGTEHPLSAPRPIHARAETVATQPMFADAFRSRRAIVPANEYFQRQTKGRSGRRYAISRADGRPMALAGLWEGFRWSDGRVDRTYCLITIEASGPVAEIHDRMPLVLDQADWPVWLNSSGMSKPCCGLHPRARSSAVPSAAENEGFSRFVICSKILVQQRDR
jgi:putative SOS response-associated peptidase YedK